VIAVEFPVPVNRLVTRTMGIRGLTGFIDRNHHLLQSHELHDCPVVIDGSNMFHFLYSGRNVKGFFGGDYDIFRKRIIETFDSFKACGITPYVVLDGAYTVDGRKFNTCLQRAKQRISMVSKYTCKDTRCYLTPLLALETFIQVLTELNIPHVTCQFEADGEIAVLANKLECSVISNDSDFYIFDLNSGFLPLDYIDFNVLTKVKEDSSESIKYISTRQYSVEDFINSFEGLNRSVLPLFASMLGNDYISKGSFSTFYGHFKVPKIVSRKYHLPENLQKVINVLHWLHSKENHTSDVIEKLLEYVGKKKQKEVSKKLNDSIQGYCDVNNFQGFNLYEFFFRTDFETTAHEEFQKFDSEEFPQWFLEAASHAQLTPFILNAAILHQVFIPCQMEDLSQPASSGCSSSLRSACYEILTKSFKRQNIEDQCLNMEQQNENECSNKEQPIQDECLQQFEDDYISKVSSAAESTRENVETLQECSSRGNQIEYSCSIKDQQIEDRYPSKEQNIEVEYLNMEQQNENECSNNEQQIVDECSNMELHIEGTFSHEEKQIEDDCIAKVFTWENTGENVDTPKDERFVKVIEFVRYHTNIRKNFVDPVKSVNGLVLPCMEDLSLMSKGDCQYVLWSILKVEKTWMNTFSEDDQLFVACICVWCLNCNSKLSKLHLYSIFVCVFVIQAHLELAMRKKLDEKYENIQQNVSHPGVLLVDLKSSVRSCSTSDLEQVVQKTKKYHFSPPAFNHKTLYEPEITHAFAELQSCIMDGLNLNKLLRTPVPNSRPACLINGTLLYNMYVELTSRPKPELFIRELLGRDSCLIHTFNAINDHLITFIGQEAFVVAPNANIKFKKPRKKNSKITQLTLKEKEDTEEENSNEEEIEQLHGFNVSNKFTMLLNM